MQQTGKRKLKCSGEPRGCSRCVKHSIVCHYSIQKQMGRPPKKRLREDDSVGLSEVAGSDTWPDTNDNQFSSFDYGNNTVGASEVHQLCPPVYFASMNRTPETPSHLLSTDDGHRHSLQPDQLTSIPATAGPWPDFSSVSAASSRLSLMPPDLSALQAFPLSPPSSDPPDTSTHCTCLSYLYLCLSHLSSLSPFPISRHTLCSLFIASKTARDVIYCEVCPKRFATGMQNIMLLGTLLNVIADCWLCVSKADAQELGTQAAPPDYVTSVMQGPNPDETWRSWLRQTVRNAVIGGPIIQSGRTQCSDSPDLLSLIKEVEERQRRWHSGEDVHPMHRASNPLMFGNGPSGSDDQCDSLAASDVGKEDFHERDLLCIRVVGMARQVISKFNFEPHEYPDGVVS